MAGDVGQSGRSAGQNTAAPVSMRWGWLLISACVILLLPVLAVGTGLWMTGGASSAGQWLPQALGSAGFIKYALITMALAAALCVTLGMMWRIAARARARSRSEDGGAIVEFALVLPFAMSLVLLLAQSSFLMVGHLCVQYSAYCAARTAIVAIPDDLSRFGGEVQNYVDPLQDNSVKHGRILRSAVWAVMPISCSAKEQAPASKPELLDGLDEFFTAYGKSTPPWVRANLERKWKYAMDHTFVELSTPVSGDLYGEAEDVRVSVRHTFYLSVPIASKIFYELDDGVELKIGIGEYGLYMRATCTLTNEGVQDYVDEETFPKDR
jgi:hypothetical protein